MQEPGFGIVLCQALNTVVGHEITHVLEGTDAYPRLAEVITQLAKTKGEYQSRYDALAELYKDQDADIEKELVADLVGDYLFEDTDFIQSLASRDRSTFQKIFDEIKYLCRAATAGSKEYKQLEKVKKQFQEVYREAAKSPAQEDGVRYSISNTRNMGWDEQVRDYFRKNGKIKSSDALYLGKSDSWLKEKGISESPLYIPTSVINKAVRVQKGSRSAHQMAETDISKLQKGVRNALAIVHNPDRNALIYVTDIKDSEGSPIIVSFDLNNDLFGENAHRATSIHGRTNLDGMFGNLGEKSTIYVKNKNKLNTLLSGTGIQSSELLAKVEFIDETLAQSDKNVKRKNSLSEESGAQHPRNREMMYEGGLTTPPPLRGTSPYTGEALGEGFSIAPPVAGRTTVGDPSAALRSAQDDSGGKEGFSIAPPVLVPINVKNPRPLDGCP